MYEKEETKSLRNFLNQLTIAFIVLKLTNVIDWTWWAVLSPLWVPMAFIVFLSLVVFVLGLCGVEVTKWQKKSKTYKNVLVW